MKNNPTPAKAATLIIALAAVIEPPQPDFFLAGVSGSAGSVGSTVEPASFHCAYNSTLEETLIFAPTANKSPWLLTFQPANSFPLGAVNVQTGNVYEPEMFSTGAIVPEPPLALNLTVLLWPSRSSVLSVTSVPSPSLVVGLSSQTATNVTLPVTE